MHSKSQIDLDPREIDAFVCGMSPRQELVGWPSETCAIAAVVIGSS
jgi:hypothetical protein